MQTTRSNVPTNEIASFGGCTLWHATPARLSPQTKTCKSLAKTDNKDSVSSFQARNQQVYWRFLNILTYRVQLLAFVSQLVGQYWSPARASLTVRDSSMISWWRDDSMECAFQQCASLFVPVRISPMMPDIVKTKRGHYSSKQDKKRKKEKKTNSARHKSNCKLLMMCLFCSLSTPGSNDLDRPNNFRSW